LIIVTWIAAVGYAIYKYNLDRKASEADLPLDVEA
jgi:hypothetical protein